MNGPLNISLNISGTVTTVPVIKNGHMAKIRLAALDLKEVEGKGQTLQFSWELCEAVPAEDGGSIEVGAFGSKLIDGIPLYAKADAKNPTWYLEKIAKTIDALLGTGDAGNKKGKPTRPDFNETLVPQLIGREAVAKFKADTYENVTRTKIDTLTFPGDLIGA